MREVKRGRRVAPTSRTVRRRGALGELRDVLSPESYTRLATAVNRERRGLPPLHPDGARKSEVTDRPPARSEDEQPRCITLEPDRWCDECAKARATPRCGVCGGMTRRTR